MTDAAKLRAICRGYPRTVVLAAAAAALGDSVRSAADRRDIASLVATWLLDDDGEADSPPVPLSFAEDLARELKVPSH